MAEQPSLLELAKLAQALLPTIEPLKQAQEAQPQTPGDFAILASRGRWKMARHLKLLNDKLTALAEGKIKRLIVTMPPRHGKSEFCSKYFPAWYIGRYPENRFILCSYQAEFAATWGEKARNILEEFGEQHFGIKVREDARARDSWQVQGRDGGMVTAGVGGSITGRGANLLSVDDPLKNSEEANSKTIREKIVQWWQSTALTRIEPNGSALIIQTRWHGDDLAGNLLAEANDPDDPVDEQWELINLPALAEENDPLGRKVGEALWPERYDASRLHRMKRRMSSAIWNALYQQRPVAAGGEIFNRNTFRYYEELSINGAVQFYKLFNAAGNGWTVKASECFYFLAVDPASSEKESADWTVVTVWAVSQSFDMILVDMSREQARISKTRETIVRLYRHWKCEFAVVEKNSIGLPLLQSLRDGGLTVRSAEARVDKVLRAQAAEMRFAAGMIHFPKVCTFQKALAALIDELESFPKGAHDDCCFVAGTIVDGKPIEEIQVGDWVTSACDSNYGFQIEKKPVTRLFKRKAKRLVRVTTANGSQVVCTPNHLFFSGTIGGYVRADMIKNQLVLTAPSFDSLSLVNRVEDVPCENECDVYNIEVEDNNNYFANGILVHNCDSLAWGAHMVNSLGGPVRDREDQAYIANEELETTALAVRAAAPGGQIESKSVVVADADIEWLEN
jgi:predicted phage terminase large subunit-like protein